MSLFACYHRTGKVSKFVRTKRSVLRRETLCDLLEAIEGHEESLRLTIKPRKCRGVKAEKVTDLNFGDVIALFRTMS